MYFNHWYKYYAIGGSASETPNTLWDLAAPLVSGSQHVWGHTNTFEVKMSIFDHFE